MTTSVYKLLWDCWRPLAVTCSTMYHNENTPRNYKFSGFLAF